MKSKSTIIPIPSDDGTTIQPTKRFSIYPLIVVCLVGVSFFLGSFWSSSSSTKSQAAGMAQETRHLYAKLENVHRSLKLQEATTTDSAQSELDEILNQINGLTSQLTNVASTTGSGLSNSAVKGLQDQIALLREDMAQVQANDKDVSTKLIDLAKRAEDILTQYNQLAASIQTVRSRDAEEGRAVTVLVNGVSVINQTLQAVQQNVTRVTARIEQAERKAVAVETRVLAESERIQVVNATLTNETKTMTGSLTALANSTFSTLRLLVDHTDAIQVSLGGNRARNERQDADLVLIRRAMWHAALNNAREPCVSGQVDVWKGYNKTLVHSPPSMVQIAVWTTEPRCQACPDGFRPNTDATACQ